jgi:hypothetical protein
MRRHCTSASTIGYSSLGRWRLAAMEGESHKTSFLSCTLSFVERTLTSGAMCVDVDSLYVANRNPSFPYVTRILSGVYTNVVNSGAVNIPGSLWLGTDNYLYLPTPFSTTQSRAGAPFPNTATVATYTSTYSCSALNNDRLLNYYCIGANTPSGTISNVVSVHTSSCFRQSTAAL